MKKASKKASSTIPKVKPIARTSLSDDIIDQIITLISEGRLKLGERLPPERELCKQFGVGRSSLREALRSLVVMGILDVRLGEGTFVSADTGRYLEKALQWGMLFNPKIVEDLIETRLTLESQTAFLAAQRAAAGDLEEIERAVRGMEKSINSRERYLDYDLKFHLAIARAAHNNILYQLLSMTRSYLQEWIKKVLSGPRAELSLREHKRILQALRKGKAEEARRAMMAHLLSTSSDLRKSFKRTKGV